MSSLSWKLSYGRDLMLSKFKKLFILLAIQLIIIFTVIKIFQTIEDRKIAAVTASVFFLSFPLWVFISDLRFKRYVYWGHFQFFYLFALPIFLTRLMYWDKDFQSIRAFGVIPAEQIHKYSNYSYVAMIFLTLVQIVIELVIEIREKKTKSPL